VVYLVSVKGDAGLRRGHFCPHATSHLLQKEWGIFFSPQNPEKMEEERDGRNQTSKRQRSVAGKVASQEQALLSFALHVTWLTQEAWRLSRSAPPLPRLHIARLS
jgi:hypothetical protein